MSFTHQNSHVSSASDSGACFVGCCSREQHGVIARPLTAHTLCPGVTQSRSTPLREDHARFYAACVVMGLEYMHERNIMWRLDPTLESCSQGSVPQGV